MRTIALSSLLVLALVISGCGSSSRPIAVSVSPSAAQALDFGQSVNITATVANDKLAKGVTWALTGPGTLSNSTTSAVTYVAPTSGTAGTATVTAASVDDASATAKVSIAVAPVPSFPTITPTAATEGTAYSLNAAATGGVGTLTYSVSVGSLPAGLSINASSGAITGTPTGPAGTVAFTVKVVDSSTVSPQSATVPLSIVVNLPPAPTINATPAPGAATEFSSYSYQVVASGYKLTYSVSVGSLPTGLTIAPGTGLISGTPTGPSGPVPFTVKVVDSSNPAQSATQAFSITVNLPTPPSITSTSPLTAGTEFVAYTNTITATGYGTLAFTIVTPGTGTLPAGLTMDTTGHITGTPTGPSGPSTFTVKVTDQSNPVQTATANFSLTINLPTAPTITTTTLPNAYVNTAYSQTLGVSNGHAPFTWSIVSGSGALPSALTLTASTGAITGTPGSTTGNFPFTVKVTDSSNPAQSATQALSITVTLGPLAVTAATLPAGALSQVYSTTNLAATGGLPPYTWSLTSAANTFPTGLTLSTSGQIAGTPTATGTYNFAVQVKDSASTTASGNFSITINPALTITTTSPLPAGTQGSSYSLNLVATGGIPSYTWSVTSPGTGSLPQGLTLSSSGQLSGIPLVSGTYPFTVQVADSANGTATASMSLTLAAAPTLTVTTVSSSLPAGVLNTAYTATQLEASGGIEPYTWSLTSAASTFPTGLTLGSNGQITGTPTATGTYSFTVQVADSATPPNTAPASLSITVGAGNAHNSYLSGRYVCLLEGFRDSDGTRWADVSSIVADGNGHITSGVYDTNGTDFTAALSGTLTGTYSVGADNNGLLTITAGTFTNQWAVALNNLAGPTAQQFRGVEIDDAGASPSGQHGTGNCYLATTSAFAASTISGNSFVFSQRGEDKSAIPKAVVGRWSALNGNLSSGYVDVADGSAAVQSAAFTGTYTTPDTTTGRFTVTVTIVGSSQESAVYIIDSSRMFFLQTTAGKGTMAGEVRKQQQTSYSNANLTGPFVLYSQGYDFTSGNVSGYYAQVFQGSGNGVSNVTINQSYSDDTGTYTVGDSNGTVVVTFDTSNPGRATVATGGGGGTAYLYFYGTNLAFEMSGGSAEWGWIQAQTQTTFTYAAMAGNYMLGNMALMEEGADGQAGEVSLASSGTITGSMTNAGPGYVNLDQAISGSYSWSSTVYGTALVTSTNDASCVVVSSTEFVCINNTDTEPSVSISQQ